MKPSFKAFLSGLIVLSAAAVVLSQDKPAHSTPAKASAVVETAARSSTNAVTTPDFPVIGYIEKRDRTLTIKAGPKGTLYSVKTADGKVLLENASAEQLRAQSPELQEFIKTAVAGEPGSKADARVRARPDASVR